MWRPTELGPIEPPKTGGVQLVLSTFVPALWFDDQNFHSVKGWGIKICLMWGRMAWRYPAVWKYSWSQVWHHILNSVTDPLPDEIEIKLPFVIGPYISICAWRFGVYFGFKAHDAADGLGLELIPSMRIRSDRNNG